jgi:hypothetical protein
MIGEKNGAGWPGGRVAGCKCTGGDGVSMLIIHTVQRGKRIKIRELHLEIFKVF